MMKLERLEEYEAKLKEVIKDTHVGSPLEVEEADDECIVLVSAEVHVSIFKTAIKFFEDDGDEFELLPGEVELILEMQKEFTNET